MKEEIKDKIDDIFWEVKKHPMDSDYLVKKEEMELLLDYITNLQEENERLKELCGKYEEEHSNAFKLWTMKMEEMPCYEEFMNYKSRIDKAIEKIKYYKAKPYSEYDSDDVIVDLDWILQGEDTNVER